MVTDTYSETMPPDVSIRSILKGSEYGEDLGILIRRQQEESGREEKELNLYRSGSAPPTIEGSLSSFGALLDGGRGFINEEELPADPANVNYYYSNVNLNPRLPPPLPSKDDWRFTQRFSVGGPKAGGVVDRRGMRRYGDQGENGDRSLFSVQPGFGGKEENGGGVPEWGEDGLIGLPGLGVGRKKSIAEFIQDDTSHRAYVQRQSSCSPSSNAFHEFTDNSETCFNHLHHELANVDALHSDGSKQVISAVQNLGAAASHTYASALGGSFPKSTSPDSQALVRAPSPCLPPIGGERSSSMDKRNNGGQNSFNAVSSSSGESADLLSAFSGMNLSATGLLNDEKHVQERIQDKFDDTQEIFNLQGNWNNIKPQNCLNKFESGPFLIHSSTRSMKGSHLNMGKNNGLGMNLHNSLLMADEQVELHNSARLSANSCLNGSSVLNSTARGGAPSNYHQLDGLKSMHSNYSIGGYDINLSSPPMIVNHHRNRNLPTLFENAATSGGVLAPGSNLLAAAAAKLPDIGKMRNPSTGSIHQLPLLDPLYLQFLRSSEIAAVQGAGLNDPAINMDLLRVQNFLGPVLSPEKSQFSVPYLGKSGLNHNYYENSPFDLGMSYLENPLAGPFLHNSHIGPGRAVRHSEHNQSLSQMRNVAGNFVGPWHSDALGDLDGNFPSSLIEEFKRNKTKCFELSEIAGHVLEFSADQYGSRFIQQKLETASMEEKNMVFHEIMPHALSLMTDVFGNYVIQKFFEHGNASRVRELADQLTGHVLTLSLQMYGCRVIQKALEVVGIDQQTKMVKELDGHIMRCVRDQNGNHVIQKCIECVPEDAIHFIVSTFYDQVVTLSTHPYGCRVVQRVLEHCHDHKTQRIVMSEILQTVCMLAQDQYGNYVVQHVLEHGKPEERSAIIKKFTGQIVQMSQQKFASNVIEKCLTFGTLEEREVLVNEMIGSTDENGPLQVMMKDQFANYVIQKVLETCDDQQLEAILNRIKVHLNALKKYTYGKHIVARVEKLVQAGERRISVLTPNPA